jgi:hypothetical protein
MEELMFRPFESAISLLTSICLIGTSFAAAADVGVVMTPGKVQVDGFEVPGTSVVFSGSRISSRDVNSMVQFRDGTSATLEPGTTMVVYSEHSVLERGIAMQHGVARHSVLADGLTISSKAPRAVVLVGVKDETHFEVAAQQDELQVSAPSGEVLARIEPGTILSFSVGQTAGATTTTTRSTSLFCGDLKANYQLTDAITNVTYQLQGADLAQYVGSAIRITGTLTGTKSGSTPQVLVVSSVRKLNHSCAKDVGAAPSAAAPAPILASTGNKIALAVLVAAGGTLLGVGVSSAASGSAAASLPAPQQPPVTNPYPPPVTPPSPY